MNNVKQNVFFLFPPGYSGNYLQWIVNVSDQDHLSTTIKNPLLPNGTTHGFVRKPTHTSVINILNWIIKNPLEQCQTFVVLAFADTDAWVNHPAWAAYRLLRSYPNAVFVNVYAETDDFVKIAALNAYTKWTTWIYDKAAFEPNHTMTFDWEGGKNNVVSLADRNWLLENWRSTFFINSQPFNWEELKHNVDCARRWYEVRQKLEPDEIDSQQFNDFAIFPKENVIDIRLEDLYNDDFSKSSVFFSWLESQNISKFDWTYAKDYHQTYLAAQENLKWNSHIDQLRKNKQVSSWLLKNSLSQAFVLEELKVSLGSIPQWQECSTEFILKTLGYDLIN